MPEAKYGSREEPLIGGRERAYLSRLHALLVNFRVGLGTLRGKFNGTESVDDLFKLLRKQEEGDEAADGFLARHGDGNFGDEKRTGLKTIRLGPKYLYEAPPILVPEEE